MAATSIITAKLRPGLTGIVKIGTSIPRISVISLSIPIRSYTFLLSQSSRLITISIFSVSLTAPIPKSLLAFIIPIPLNSIKCRIFSGAAPTSDFLETLRISTASSAISLCPRLISSIAVSLLPTPLSPTINKPSP